MAISSALVALGVSRRLAKLFVARPRAAGSVPHSQTRDNVQEPALFCDGGG
jgi:hypothetical protein